MAETPRGRLTPSSITLLQETSDTSGKPVVQVLDLSLLPSQPNRSDRYRILLSDGATSCHAMLATQLTPLVRAGTISLHTIVRLNDFVIQDIRDAASGTSTRVVVVLTLDVLGPGGGVVGSPAPYTPASAQPATAPLNVTEVIGFDVPEPGAHAATGSATVTSGGLMSMAAQSPVRATAHHPISSINPYQHGWKIRGRCSFKSPLKTFTNMRGQGKILSFELTDSSGSIRVTGFRDYAVEAQALVHVGSMYSLSGAAVRPENEKFNRSSSAFEIMLDSRSVLKAIDDDGSVAALKFTFTKIRELDKLPAGECDVVAVVHRVSEVNEIGARSTGEAVKRRVITLVDDSGASVELTFFGDQCARYLIDNDDAHPVVVLQGAKRSDFNSVSLGVTGSTTVLIDPSSVPEASILRSWYDAHAWTEESLRAMTGSFGVSAGVFGDRKALADALAEDVAPKVSSGAAVSFAMRGYVTLVKKERGLWYPADPQTKKKVTEVGDGIWRSAGGEKDFSEAEVDFRYLTNIRFSDFSGAQWAASFEESSRVAFGRPAKEMRHLLSADPYLFDDVVDDIYFRPVVVKLSVKENLYQGEARIRYTVSRLEKVDFVAEGRALLSEIARLRIENDLACRSSSPRSTSLRKSR